MNPLSAFIEFPSYQQLLSYATDEKNPQNEVIIDHDGLEHRGYILAITPKSQDEQEPVRHFTIRLLGAEGRGVVRPFRRFCRFSLKVTPINSIQKIALTANLSWSDKDPRLNPPSSQVLVQTENKRGRSKSPVSRQPIAAAPKALVKEMSNPTHYVLSSFITTLKDKLVRIELDDQTTHTGYIREIPIMERDGTGVPSHYKIKLEKLLNNAIEIEINPLLKVSKISLVS